MSATVTQHRSPLNLEKPAQDHGVKLRFNRRLVDERRIPFYKVGRFVRLDPDVTDHFLADSMVPASEWP